MRRKLFLFSLMLIFSLGMNAQQTLIISEVADPGDDYQGRFVELYNATDATIDFSATTFYLAKQANGGSWVDVQLTGTVLSGETYVVGVSTFEASYGFTPDLESGIPNGNGDDGYFLYINGDNTTGTLLDAYGVIDVDGTGEAWEYEDSQAVRAQTIGTANTTWTAGEWTITAADLANMTPGVHTCDYPAVPTNDQTSYANNTGVTQPTGANIPSINWDETTPTVTPIFQFNIADAGSGDGLPTEVTAITIKAGSSNTGDWTEDIGGGYLYKESTSTMLTITTEPDVQPDQVTFFIDDTELDIADGGSELITLYIWPDSTVADNSVIDCMIDADAHGFIADPAGSDFAADFGTDIISNSFAFTVDATQFSFVTQPSNVFVDVPMSNVVVGTTDINGNIDIDDGGTGIEVIFSGTGNMFGSTGQLNNNGIVTYTDLVFDTEQTGVYITAHNSTGEGFADIVSETFDVEVLPVISIPYNRDFETGDLNTDGWSTQLIVGALDWYIGTYNENSYAKMSNYSKGNSASETWLISPAIDLSGVSNAVFNFMNSCNYTGDDIEVYISTDYDGYSTPSSATWDVLSPTLSGGSYDWVNSGDLNISAYTGGNAYVAFKYIGTDSDGKTWQIDDINISEPATDPGAIVNAFAVDNDAIILIYENALTAVDPADYTLDQGTTVTFASADINPGDPTMMIVYGSDTDFLNDVNLDNISDAANATNFDFYAGVLPVAMTNTANHPDTVMQGYNVTLTGVVTANDDYNQVWLQDSEAAMGGISIRDQSGFTDAVSVGDLIIVVAKKEFNYGMTQMTNPILLDVVSGSVPVSAIINSGDLYYDAPLDDPTAEVWENQLVTVESIEIDSLDSSNYEYYGTDSDGNVICFDDDADYHYGSGFSLTIGELYNVTGVVSYSYDHYKINPRGIDDGVLIERDYSSTVEAPATQVPGEILDATVVIDSLNSVEVFKFNVVDEGTDGLPTRIEQITLYGGPNNTLDFASDDIDGGWLDFGDAENPIVFTEEPTVTANQFTFTVDASTATIDNGTSREITGHLWFNPAVVDETVLQFMIQADLHGFDAHLAGSQLVDVFTDDIIGGEFTLDQNVAVNTISENAVQVFPNPAYNVLHINTNEQIAKVEIINILGQNVQTTEFDNNSVSVNISGLKQGMYFVKVSALNGMVNTQTFIKK